MIHSTWNPPHPPNVSYPQSQQTYARNYLQIGRANGGWVLLFKKRQDKTKSRAFLLLFFGRAFYKNVDWLPECNFKWKETHTRSSVKVEALCLTATSCDQEREKQNTDYFERQTDKITNLQLQLYEFDPCACNSIFCRNLLRFLKMCWFHFFQSAAKSILLGTQTGIFTIVNTGETG